MATELIRMSDTKLTSGDFVRSLGASIQANPVACGADRNGRRLAIQRGAILHSPLAWRNSETG